ncbi:MAG: hypothetical protein ACREF8_03815 [Chthoniobacterales bacterium]
MSIRKKLLDQQLVTEFAEFRALKSKIEKWLDPLRDSFLEKFAGGYVCPTGGPFLLQEETGSTSNINWKEEFFARLKNDFESSGSSCDTAEKLATVKMAEMERLAGATPYKKIAVKPNPSYNGKLMRAIVKKLDARSERGF